MLCNLAIVLWCQDRESGNWNDRKLFNDQRFEAWNFLRNNKSKVFLWTFVLETVQWNFFLSLGQWINFKTTTHGNFRQGCHGFSARRLSWSRTCFVSFPIVYSSVCSKWFYNSHSLTSALIQTGMDGECLSVTVVERIAKPDTLGGYVFLVFLLCLVVGFILGLLLARYVLRQLEVFVWRTV